MHEIHDFLHQVNADVPVVLIYASAGTVAATGPVAATLDDSARVAAVMCTEWCWLV